LGVTLRRPSRLDEAVARVSPRLELPITSSREASELTRCFPSGRRCSTIAGITAVEPPGGEPWRKFLPCMATTANRSPGFASAMYRLIPRSRHRRISAALSCMILGILRSVFAGSSSPTRDGKKFRRHAVLRCTYWDSRRKHSRKWSTRWRGHPVDLSQQHGRKRCPCCPPTGTRPDQVSPDYPRARIRRNRLRISDGFLESKIGDRESQLGWKGHPELPIRASHASSLPHRHFWCYDPCGIEIAVNGSGAEVMPSLRSLKHLRKINESLWTGRACSRR